MRQAVIGPVLGGLLEFGQGVVELSLHLQKGAQIVVRLGTIGIDLDRPPKSLPGIGKLPQVEHHDAVIVVAIGAVGVQADGGLIFLFGLFVVSRPGVKLNQIDVRLHVLGIDLERLQMLSDRPPQVPRLLEIDPAPDERQRASVELLHGGAQRVHGGRHSRDVGLVQREMFIRFLCLAEFPVSERQGVVRRAVLREEPARRFERHHRGLGVILRRLDSPQAVMGFGAVRVFVNDCRVELPRRLELSSREPTVRKLQPGRKPLAGRKIVRRQRERGGKRLRGFVVLPLLELDPPQVVHPLERFRVERVGAAIAQRR